MILRTTFYSFCEDKYRERTLDLIQRTRDFMLAEENIQRTIAIGADKVRYQPTSRMPNESDLDFADRLWSYYLPTQDHTVMLEFRFTYGWTREQIEFILTALAYSSDLRTKWLELLNEEFSQDE